jgi:hypothetical protein
LCCRQPWMRFSRFVSGLPESEIPIEIKNARILDSWSTTSRQGLWLNARWLLRLQSYSSIISSLLQLQTLSLQNRLGQFPVVCPLIPQ